MLEFALDMLRLLLDYDSLIGWSGKRVCRMLVSFDDTLYYLSQSSSSVASSSCSSLPSSSSLAPPVLLSSVPWILSMLPRSLSKISLKNLG